MLKVRFLQTFWLRKGTVVTNNINNGSILSTYLSSHVSVTVSQHAQYQDRESEAAKWNSATTNFIIYLCALCDKVKMSWAKLDAK